MTGADGASGEAERFAELDRQLDAARQASEKPDLPDHVWGRLATTVHDEVAALPEAVVNKVRTALPIAPERYLEEMTAFQAWTDIARANENNPVIVRAQVMTQNYVAFVWLRDSVMTPLAAIAPGTTFAAVERFLASGTRRALRNAIAHGRWCYLPDFSGLECWDGAKQHTRFTVGGADLGAWQLLSRGTAIAALLAIAS